MVLRRPAKKTQLDYFYVGGELGLMKRKNTTDVTRNRNSSVQARFSIILVLPVRLTIEGYNLLWLLLLALVLI